MPHKYVTPELIKNLELEIGACDVSIKRIRSIKSGGTDGLKELGLQVKDLMETARDKKDQALDLMMNNGAGVPADPKLQEKAALICRGQEKAFQIVLNMLENPDEAVFYYKSQKEQFEKEIAKYRTFEQCPE